MSLPVNWLPQGKMYQLFNYYNTKIIHRTIRKLIKDFKIKKYLYLNSFNPYGPIVLPRSLKASLNIYQSVDDISQDDYTAKHGLRLEEEAIRRADVTLVTSKELWNLKSGLSSNIHILNNAADSSVFKKALEEKFLRPKELEGKVGKVVGFVGNLDELRINYSLIKKAALHYKDVTFLLVGPLNNIQYMELGLVDIPNIIFTGGKHLHDLPQYLQYMDCALIPFLCNTLTKSIYPLKINEYLAAGKPIVTTNFSEDIQNFKEYVYLANSEEDFIHLIAKALEPQCETTIKNRVALAETNSWTARVEQFWKIVEKYLKGQRVRE